MQLQMRECVECTSLLNATYQPSGLSAFEEREYNTSDRRNVRNSANTKTAAGSNGYFPDSSWAARKDNARETCIKTRTMKDAIERVRVEYRGDERVDEPEFLVTFFVESCIKFESLSLGVNDNVNGIAVAADDDAIRD
jgi:hypothetical protein